MIKAQAVGCARHGYSNTSERKMYYTKKSLSQPNPHVCKTPGSHELSQRTRDQLQWYRGVIVLKIRVGSLILVSNDGHRARKIHSS